MHWRRLPFWRRLIQRHARSFRGASYPDLVQAGWASTITRGNAAHAREAMHAVSKGDT